MYRLCLTSAALFILGAGASHAQQTSAPIAEATAKIESPVSAAIESPAPSGFADSSATANADSSAAAGSGEAPAPASEAKTNRAARKPTKTVEIKDIGEQTICEDVKLPASRIVVERRCYTRNIYDRSEAKNAERRSVATEMQVRELRRLQDDMERAEREREMARERAIMAIAAGRH